MRNLIKKILREQADNYDGIPNIDGIPNNEPVSFNRSEIQKKINNLRAFFT